MTAKITALITAVALAGLFAVAGCQKQEGQKGGQEAAPGTAPSSTQTTTGSESK